MTRISARPTACSPPRRATSSDGAPPQGQRVSMSLRCQDFRQERRVHQATDHLAAEAVFDRMTLEKGDREASQPAKIVAQCALAGATVVLAEVHVQHPVHRLDAPMTAHRLAETLAAEIPAENVVPRLVDLTAIGVLG